MTHYVKSEVCVGEPIFKKLYRKLFKHNNIIDPCVAWALMREYLLKDGVSKEADLMYIYTNENGQGNGLKLLNMIKDEYVAIRTQWSGSTKAGRESCLSAGFIREPGTDLLVYIRDKK
jgi:hypothetical protein